MRCVVLLSSLALSGCWEFAPKPDPDKPPGRLPNPILADNQAWVPPDPEHASRFSGKDGGADLLIRSTGIGGDYRDYFLEAERLADLSNAIGPCVDESAELVLSYKSSSSDGRMVLVVPKARLTCQATQGEDGAVDITPLRPLTQGVAAYRRSLGNTRDLRLHSWRVGVLIDEAGARGVTLWLGGTPPEDGTEVSPCVDVDGRTQCPEGADPRSGVTELAPADRKVRRALAKHLGVSD